MSDANWIEDSIRDFFVAMGEPVPVGLDVGNVRTELRARMILEEALETVRALGFEQTKKNTNELRQRYSQPDYVQPDWAEVIDGVCDIVYISVGTLVEAGIPFQRFFAEVHRSNMLKVGGPKNEHGKILKPEGWEPPRIEYLLNRLCEKHGVQL